MLPIERRHAKACLLTKSLCKALLAWLPVGVLMLASCMLRWPESPPVVKQVALADLDGDGFVDAVLANGRFGEPYSYPTQIRYQILYNDGTGRFDREGQLLEKQNHCSVALGDLNGDNAIDALLGLTIRLNDGKGALQGLIYLGTDVTLGVFEGGAALADLNSDGHLDVFIANCCGGVAFGRPSDPTLLPPHNLVFLNDGAGRFTATDQLLGKFGSYAVALGDLNGDGYLDAFVVNGQTQIDTDRVVHNAPNTVWFNRGDGLFDDSLQRLGSLPSQAVALGDVNGDGYLDAVVGNDGNDEIWLNDGQGFFHDSGDQLANDLTKEVFLADLDGNSSLDLVTAGETVARVWMNDGSGHFTDSGQTIRFGKHDAVALADLDNDGVPDLFVAGINVYAAWFNDGHGRLEQR